MLPLFGIGLSLHFVQKGVIAVNKRELIWFFYIVRSDYLFACIHWGYSLMDIFWMYFNEVKQ